MGFKIIIELCGLGLYNLLGTLALSTNKLECLFEVNILSLFEIDAGLFAQQRVVELTAKSGVFTSEKTLNVVAIASHGDLKRWESFY